MPWGIAGFAKPINITDIEKRQQSLHLLLDFRHKSYHILPTKQMGKGHKLARIPSEKLWITQILRVGFSHTIHVDLIYLPTFIVEIYGEFHVNIPFVPWMRWIWKPPFGYRNRATPRIWSRSVPSGEDKPGRIHGFESRVFPEIFGQSRFTWKLLKNSGHYILQLAAIIQVHWTSSSNCRIVVFFLTDSL